MRFHTLHQNRHDEKDAEETRQDKIRLFTSADREACSTMLLLLISTSAVTVVSFNSCPRIYIHMTYFEIHIHINETSYFSLIRVDKYVYEYLMYFIFTLTKCLVLIYLRSHTNAHMFLTHT